MPEKRSSASTRTSPRTSSRRTASSSRGAAQARTRTRRRAAAERAGRRERARRRRRGRDEPDRGRRGRHLGHPLHRPLRHDRDRTPHDRGHYIVRTPATHAACSHWTARWWASRWITSRSSRAGEANRARAARSRTTASRACSRLAVSATRRARVARRARVFAARESPRSRVARACWLSLRALSLCAETQDEQGRNPEPDGQPGARNLYPQTQGGRRVYPHRVHGVFDVLSNEDACSSAKCVKKQRPPPPPRPAPSPSPSRPPGWARRASSACALSVGPSTGDRARHEGRPELKINEGLLDECLRGSARQHVVDPRSLSGGVGGERQAPSRNIRGTRASHRVPTVPMPRSRRREYT